MLNLNPARGALTSLRLIGSAPRPALSNPRHRPALIPHLIWVKSETSMSRRHLGTARAGPQYDYRSRQSGAVCHQ